MVQDLGSTILGEKALFRKGSDSTSTRKVQGEAAAATKKEGTESSVPP